MQDFAAGRLAMVDRQIRPSDVTRYPVIDAFLGVPREAFVPSSLRAVAYAGAPVPLGEGRVLLEPRTFAKMVNALAPGPEELILDVGCGLGYSAAILARLAQAVVAVEEIEGMATQAAEALLEHGTDNAVVEHAALADGAPVHGPYDAIIVEGGVEQIPEALLAQVKPGGRIVAILMQGATGQAALGQLPEGQAEDQQTSTTSPAWRRLFDATAPVLPGFAASRAFTF
ncbi:MAG: protein-L-isoaspartate O-methyltransferase [Pseudomonadota bacterium]